MKECYKVRNLFGSYLYDGVTPDERSFVEEHLKACEKCSSELRSLQEVLNEVRLEPQRDDMPQIAQDDFAANVYRKIASDVLRRRSRQVYLRRFVLQPSLAAAVAAVVIAVGFFRFYPGVFMGGKPSPAVVKNDDAISTRERRVSQYAEEFFRSQGTLYEPRADHAIVEKASTREGTSSDIDRFMQDRLLPDSQRLLQEADLINYSLRDPRRALAKYRLVVDYYPHTDAAIKARGRINAILGVEYNIQADKTDADQTTEVGI